MLIQDNRFKPKGTLLDNTNPGQVFVWNGGLYLRLKSNSDLTLEEKTRKCQVVQVVRMDNFYKTTLSRNFAVEIVNATLTIETVS